MSQRGALFLAGSLAESVGKAFTPAGLQPTRLQCISPTQLVFATGPHLFTAKRTADAWTSAPLGVEQLPDEIQSISVVKNKSLGTVLAAIDKQGNGQFTRFNDAGEPETIVNFALPLTEADWCGVCIHPTDPVAAAVASLNRAIGLFSLETGDMIAFRNALQPPSSLSWLPSFDGDDRHNLIITERTDLAAYAASASGITNVYRETVSKDRLWAVHGNDKLVACSGIDSNLCSMQLNNWGKNDRVRCPTKYEVIGLHVSPTATYIAGRDNEIFCFGMDEDDSKRSTFQKGSKKQRVATADTSSKTPVPTKLTLNHKSGFRGDSRWIGFDVCQSEGADFLVAVSEKGSLYVINNAPEKI